MPFIIDIWVIEMVTFVLMPQFFFLIPTEAKLTQSTKSSEVRFGRKKKKKKKTIFNLFLSLESTMK